VSLEFGIFGLSWTSTDLALWMTVAVYMTWPNDRLTSGSTDDSWAVQKLMWQGDWAIRKLTW
jgi:hypothetical protein